MKERKFISILREEFFKRLAQKTGWGRNEIIKIFNEAITEASLRLLDELTSEHCDAIDS